MIVPSEKEGDYYNDYKCDKCGKVDSGERWSCSICAMIEKNYGWSYRSDYCFSCIPKRGNHTKINVVLLVFFATYYR